MGYFPPALEALMQPGADAQDMGEVIILLNQLMIRFKDALQPLLLKVRIFSPVAMLSHEWSCLNSIQAALLAADGRVYCLDCSAILIIYRALQGLPCLPLRLQTPSM